MQKFLTMAVELARQHEYEPEFDFRLCALIVKGGSVLSVGFNGLNKNSFVDYLAEKDGTSNKPYINMHAEMSAISSARSKIDLRGCKLYVARIKLGGVGMARPCGACQLAAALYGIRRMVYTVDDREWGTIKV